MSEPGAARRRNGSAPKAVPSLPEKRSVRSWVAYGLIGFGGMAVAAPGIPGIPFMLLGAWLLPPAHPLRNKMFDFAARCFETGARATARISKKNGAAAPLPGKAPRRPHPAKPGPKNLLN